MLVAGAQGQRGSGLVFGVQVAFEWEPFKVLPLAKAIRCPLWMLRNIRSIFSGNGLGTSVHTTSIDFLYKTIKRGTNSSRVFLHGVVGSHTKEANSSETYQNNKSQHERTFDAGGTGFRFHSSKYFVHLCHREECWAHQESSKFGGGEAAVRLHALLVPRLPAAPLVAISPRKRSPIRQRLPLSFDAMLPKTNAMLRMGNVDSLGDPACPACGLLI